MLLVTSKQMREIDRAAIEDRGVDAFRLMEAAGRAVVMDVAEQFPTGSAVIISGPGNNGGDGFVVARYLSEAGWEVTVVYRESPAENEEPARRAWEQLPEAVRLRRLSEIQNLRELVSSHDVAVDAIFGTGTKGEPRAPWDEVIMQLNAAHLPVFSIDIPSGLDPDSGVAKLAVHAFRTITIGLAKVGMVTNDGPDFCGSVRVEPILFPKTILNGQGSEFQTLTMEEAAALLPERARTGHKGTFGLLVLAAGCAAMPGAATLSAMGAMRAGCGLVRMLVPKSIRDVTITNVPEVLLATGEFGIDSLESGSEQDWSRAFSKACAIAVGPGIGTHETTVSFLSRLLKSELPMVLDADALNIIVMRPALAKNLKPHHILTPHPGEMSSLLGVTVEKIQANRWHFARMAAEKFGCVVVLKGSGSLVAQPGGTVAHVGAGNTSWARGGAGDVLTGVIGSLLAQGMTSHEAAKLGVFVHGLAADIYTRYSSARGAITRDVAGCLPKAFRELEKFHSPDRDDYGTSG